MLSDYCQNIKNLHGNRSGNVSKLIPTLNKKTNDVLHYRNLKLYQSLGLQTTKIHRVFFYGENKKVIGKFKDEAAGKPILEFIGLKSKMYSYSTGDKNNKTAKGVKKNIIKREIGHSDYRD